MQSSNQMAELWPIAAYFIILCVLLIIMMSLSVVLGPKTNTRAKHVPYESGVISVNDNKTRFTNHFFLYAIFFVIFDLETIFLFAWVIAFDEVGWAGFIEASIFIATVRTRPRSTEPATGSPTCSLGPFAGSSHRPADTASSLWLGPPPPSNPAQSLAQTVERCGDLF